MKTRNGFVSNSSSSSFIIAINNKNNKPCKLCGRKDKDFLNFLVDRCENDPEYNGEPTEIVALSAEEVKKYWQNNVSTYFGDKGHDLTKKVFKSINDAVKKKKEVVFFNVSYHNSEVNEELYVQLCAGNVEKIWSDHDNDI